MDTRAHLLNTQLNDRVLWFDGSSAFDSSKLLRLVNKYDLKYVTHDSPEVKAFNRHVSKEQELRVKTECEPLSAEWNFPDDYKNLDVVDYLYSKHVEITQGLPTDESNARDIRLITELVKYDKFGLMDVLRATIWTINTLMSNDIVWGVGRGSSVSSYVLYVIGVHDVDSFAYDLDVDDFLHE